MEIPQDASSTHIYHWHFQWNSPDFIVAGMVLMLLVKKETQQHFNLCFDVSLGELVSSTEEVVWHSLELYQYHCHLKYLSWIQFHMLLSKHCTFLLVVDQNVILDTNYCPVDMYFGQWICCFKSKQKNWQRSMKATKLHNEWIISDVHLIWNKSSFLVKSCHFLAL